MAPWPASLTWGASQAFRKAVRMAAMSSGRKLYSLGAVLFGMMPLRHHFKFRNLQVCPARKQRVDCPVLTSEQMPTGRDRKKKIAIAGLAVLGQQKRLCRVVTEALRIVHGTSPLHFFGAGAAL